MDLRQETNRRGKLGPGEVERLVADLYGDGPTRRDAAVARLRVAGARAFAQLSALIRSDAPAVARAAALSVLEGQEEPRGAEVARAAAIDPDDDVAIAAVGVLRGWLTREQGTQALETLTTLALDRQRDARVRLAALDALSELPRHLVAPILDRAPLDDSTGPALDDPLAAREWLAGHEAAAPLSALHDLVRRVRERERAEPDGRRQEEWTSVRGAVHAALARRGSRVALYDLREAFESATRPLPGDFLTAAAHAGDASCLEPLARAWAAARGEPWWRTRLTEAASDIVARQRLTGRHATLKRVRAKWPGFV